jgi:hypothetical protein
MSDVVFIRHRDSRQCGEVMDGDGDEKREDIDFLDRNRRKRYIVLIEYKYLVG